MTIYFLLVLDIYQTETDFEDVMLHRHKTFECAMLDYSQDVVLDFYESMLDCLEDVILD